MIASELRIGNYFTPVMDDGTELQEKQIEAKYFLALFNNPKRGLPIKLTEEWLLNFGFKKWGYWYVKNKFYLDLYKNLAIDKYILPFESPKYVHQLQNLFYDLIGQELTIETTTPPPHKQ